MLTNHTDKVNHPAPTAISQEILKLVVCRLKNASSFFWKCYQVAWEAHKQNQTQRDASNQIIKLTKSGMCTK